MPNKINTRDYNFTLQQARAYVEFMLWIQANPQGGTFKHGNYVFQVQPQQNLYNTVKNKV